MYTDLSLSEFIIGQIFFLGFIKFLDYLLCFMFGKKSRWFQLHALVNTIIVILVYKDTINLFLNPLTSLNLVVRKEPGILCSALHVYHIIVFDNLTIIDYSHHILSVFLAGIPAIFFWDNPLISAWYIFG